MTEENKVILENEPQNEGINFAENTVIDENQTQTEETPTRESSEMDTGQQEPPKKSKRSFLSGISTSLIVIVAASVVGITNLLNVSMNAQFVDEATQYLDGKIRYEINVENMTEKESLNAYLYEGDELIETIPLYDEDGDGVIEGEIPLDKEAVQAKLDAGDNVRVEYRMDLKGTVGLNVERAFDSYKFRIDKFSSSIESVDMWCSCGVDGYYNFKINYTDPLEKFQNFEAYIEDEKGNRSVCTFTDDPHEAQRIFVNNLSGSRCKLYIKYLENGEEAFIQFSNSPDGSETEQKDNYKIINL